ncbi:MAG: LuxR family transcriptional regulator, partial [Thermoleophilia bacterium]|nr:LuxR family transcriptional regulator [Thermoleophilia bacterium]
PTEDELADSDRVHASAAVRLFEARAAERSSASADQDRTHVVARICARVDGLPLGIELAAARAHLLSPQEILDRLDRRMSLLAHTGRTGRHASLRSAIEWSYELLSADEQAMFRVLGAFVGGCTVQAALDVARGSGADDIDLIDRLDSLVSKSLVQRTNTAGGVRISMLETIADFAAEVLDVDPEAADIRGRAYAWFHLAAKRADTFGDDGESRVARELILDDTANVRAAVRAYSGSECSTAIDILEALGDVCLLHGAAAFGAELHDEISAAAPLDLHANDRARLALCGAEWLRGTGRAAEAEVLARSAVEVFRQSGDARRLCRALLWWGEALAHVGEVEAALVTLLEAKELALVLRDHRLAAHINWRIGTPLEDLGRFDEMLPIAREALAWFEQVGDVHGVAYATMNLGCALGAAGEADEARAHFERAASLARRNGYRTLESHALCNLASSLLELGRINDAIETFDTSLATWQEGVDSQVLIAARSLEAFARSQVGAHAEAVGAAIDSIDRAIATRRVAFAHQAMFAVARAASALGAHEIAARAWGAIDPALIHDDFLVDSAVGIAMRAAVGSGTSGGADPVSSLERLEQGWVVVRPFALRCAGGALELTDVGYASASTLARPDE